MKVQIQVQNSHPTYSTAGDDRAEHSSALNAANQVTISQNTHEITFEQLTYAAIDKSKKNKVKKQTKKENSKYIAAENGDLYMAVMKKPKDGSMEAAPPLPPHTVEELYTAVMKKSKKKCRG